MFSHSTLTELAAHTGVPKLSLFLPTSPSTAKTLDAATHLKNLLRDAAAQLEKRGWGESDIDTFLSQPTKRVSDREFWQHQQHGLAIFVSTTGVLEVSVANTLEPNAVVGDHFDVLPLMPGLSTPGNYALLCVSQSEVSVYLGNHTGLTDVRVSGMPVSLDDVVTDADYQNPVLASPPSRPNTGSQNMSNAQVYGQAPPEWQEMVRKKFAHQVVSALGSSAELSGLPVVVIADEDLAGDIAKAVGAVGVSTTHPTSLTLEQRHDVSWGVVRDPLDQTRQKQLADMAERLGQNSNVATDPAEIITMAKEGRVATLCISHTTPDEAISESLWATLATSGDVVFAGEHASMPESGVVALLRY